MFYKYVLSSQLLYVVVFGIKCSEQFTRVLLLTAAMKIFYIYAVIFMPLEWNLGASSLSVTLWKKMLAFVIAFDQ